MGAVLPLGQLQLPLSHRPVAAFNLLSAAALTPPRARRPIIVETWRLRRLLGGVCFVLSVAVIHSFHFESARIVMQSVRSVKFWEKWRVSSVDATLILALRCNPLLGAEGYT